MSAMHALLVVWERVASWLVGAGSERQVVAVVCGSGIAYRVVVPFCLVGYPL